MNKDDKIKEIAKAISERTDRSVLTLEELNRRTAAAGAGFDVPGQMDGLSSANDAPPSRQEFASLNARVVYLEGVITYLMGRDAIS